MGPQDRQHEDGAAAGTPEGSPVEASAPEVAAAEPAAPRRRGVLADGTLDPRDNSLNLVRLFLAWAVLFSHSFYITDNGTGPVWHNDNLGGWAVIGFFVISGYLITGARERADGGKYVVNRAARIFPGFLVVLVVTALVFAPIAYVHEFGSLDGYWTASPTPLNFFLNNMLLSMQQYDIAGTLQGMAQVGSWNGSAWTLYFEFFMYLVVGLLLTVPHARRHAWPTIVLWVVFVVAWANWEALAGYTEGNSTLQYVLKLGGYFLGGAVVWKLRRFLPLHWWAALPALAVGLLTVHWQPDWGGQLAAPLFTYFVLWLGSWLREPGIVRTNDLSYGVYIYAWPLQQLLALFGVEERHGFAWYVVAVTVASLAAALVSWWLVERPAMRLARGRSPFGRGSHR